MASHGCAWLPAPPRVAARRPAALSGNKRKCTAAAVGTCCIDPFLVRSSAGGGKPSGSGARAVLEPCPAGGRQTTLLTSSTFCFFLRSGQYKSSCPWFWKGSHDAVSALHALCLWATKMGLGLGVPHVTIPAQCLSMSNKWVK